MTYTRHSAYLQASATSWTRIDMLIALYDATLFAVEQGLQAIREEDQPSLIQHRFRAQRLISQLIVGVDLEQGELPQNIHRLLTFCLMQICGGSNEEWTAAISTLSELKQAFDEIRDHAVEMEKSGQIPALDMGMSEQFLAVG